MSKCMVTSCDNNTGFGDCMYPDIKECNTRDQSNIQKAYKQDRADVIDYINEDLRQNLTDEQWLINGVAVIPSNKVFELLDKCVEKLKEKQND